MKKFSFLLSVLLVGSVVHAQQDPSSRVIKVNPLMDTADQLVKFVYHYPGFQTGQAVFKDGNTVQALFNYNLLLRELLFIAPNGDTLALNNPERYRYILLGADTLYFTNKGTFWLVGRQGDNMLLKRNLLRNLGSEKKAAYGGYSSGASITSVGTVTNQDNMLTKLKIDENTFYGYETDYFLMDKFGNVMPASKKSLYNVFSKKGTALRQYLQAHTIDFHKEKDLVDLLHFLQEQ